MNQHAVIEIDTRTWPLINKRVDITIDGTAYSGRRGSYSVEVLPGEHVIMIWSRANALIPRAGRASVIVSVAAGDVLRVRYHYPVLPFLAGKITVGGRLPVARALR